MSSYTDTQRADAIEEMMSKRRYILEFIEDGADLQVLVCLFLSRGLPFRDRSQRDDDLIDVYDDEERLLKAQFSRFAESTQTGRMRSRVDTYLDYLETIRLEDAA